MSFAVIKTGGKQYKVAVGDTIKVETLGDEKKLEFIDLLNNKKVLAEVTGAGKMKKVRVLKHQAKKRHNTANSHRQKYFEIKILKIN